MSMVEGGKSDLAVFESFVEHIRTGLHTIGWFDTNRLHPPLKIVYDYLPDTVEFNVNENTFLNFTQENVTSVPAEVGSNASVETYFFYVDVFARDSEGSAGLGRELAGDVKALLLGKFYSIGYDEPVITVYDFRSKPPTDLGWVEVDDVTVIQSRRRNRTDRTWFQIAVEIVEGRA